ncbi:hypothetical protein [Aliarcobacter butzleri]|uniref:hypothetical protein n=1 Tax=Aliarcobacter butzleri TaxID=28197 RepID=UPI00125F6725|nr:hypothetical protein [Aliarcobacter butzleri]
MMHLKAKIITSASAILLCGSLFAQDVYTVKNMSLKQALEKIAYAGTIRTASRFTSGHSAGVDSDS